MENTEKVVPQGSFDIAMNLLEQALKDAVAYKESYKTMCDKYDQLEQKYNELLSARSTIKDNQPQGR